MGRHAIEHDDVWCVAGNSRSKSTIIPNIVRMHVGSEHIDDESVTGWVTHRGKGKWKYRNTLCNTWRIVWIYYRPQ